MSSKSEILIVDTGAFVRNVPLWDYAERLVTVKDIIYEIKDKQTQRIVDAYPVPIEYVAPKAESIKFINEFTKKTGDYAVLSAPDVKILALAYETEVETHGSDHLRLEPLQRVTNNHKSITINKLKSVAEKEEPVEDENNATEESQSQSNDMEEEIGEEDEGDWCPCVRKKTRRRPHMMDGDGNISVTSTASRKRESWTRDALPGFYIPKVKDEVSSVPYQQAVVVISAMQTVLLDAIENHLIDNSYISGPAHPKFYDEFLLGTIITKLTSSTTLSEEQMGTSWDEKLDFAGLSSLLKICQYFTDLDSQQTLNLDEYPSIRRWMGHMKSFDEFTSFVTNCELHEVSYDLLRNLEDLVDQQLEDSVICGDAEEESDSDDGGWITPDNIGNIAKGLPLNYDPETHQAPEQQEEQSTVACITGDFAMQNVLHHIGIKILGVDGKIIKEARTYTLRCFACYKLCPNMSKLFCPNCGNRTLKRVSVTLNPDGTQNVWISKRRLNTRGLRYNLPRPRAGKHAIMPLLTADQRFPQQWAKKQKKVDIMDPSYIARDSPFMTNDVYSRAAQLGCRVTDDRGIKGQLMHAKIWKPKKKKKY